MSNNFFRRRTSLLILIVMSLSSCGFDSSSLSRLSDLPAACWGQNALGTAFEKQKFWLESAFEGNEKQFSKLVVFGDSLSDTGNLRSASRIAGIGPVLLPSCLYWEGRFSNGPVWLDYLSYLVADEYSNFAVGGAATRENAIVSNQGLNGFLARLTPTYWTDQISRSWINSLSEQIDLYAEEKQRDAHPAEDQQKPELAIIWIGANNYLNDGLLAQNEQGQVLVKEAKVLVEKAISDIKKSVIRLSGLGIRHVALATIPELAGLPQNPSSPDPVQDETYRLLTKLHNEKLQDLLVELEPMIPSGGLILLEAFEINQRTLENPLEFGFTDLSNPCYKGSLFSWFSSSKAYCEDFFGRKLWDWVHPNSQMHCLYANQFLYDLTNQVVGMASYDKQKGKKRCLELSRNVGRATD